MKKRRMSPFALVLLIFVSVLRIQAVDTTGTILGTVHDSAGASVPNAKVTVVEQDTGVTRSVMSDEEGNYVFKLLPVGTYTVRVERDGFQTSIQKDIVLNLNQNARVDVTLKPGSIREQIVVEGDVLQAETTVATVGKVVTQQSIVTLPLNSRNFLQLGILQPGVSPITTNLAKSGSGAAVDQGFTVNGLRTQANVFMIDGALNTDLFFTSSVLRPPPDAIQEFKILTNSYPPEYWGGGSVVNLISKTGTNALHGAVWEFLRNNVLDARNFFSKTAPVLKQNQFGFGVGGPVFIPKVYDGRNQTFFYVYYEGFRNRNGITSNTGVPSLLERKGDFSQSSVKPIDPSTGQPFPGNILPINPISAKLLDLYPEPNSGVNTFSSSPSLSDDRNGFGIRIDHHFNHDNDALWGRYLRNKLDQIQPFVPFGALVPGFPGVATQFPQTVVLGETHVFTSALLNDLRVSYVRLNFGSPLFSRRDKLSDFGFLYPTTAPDFETVPFVSIPGLSSLGNPQGPGARVTNTYEIRDAVSYARGRHDVKFGIDLRRTEYGIFFGSSVSGSFAFTGQFTRNALADFLLGRASTFTQSTIGIGHLRGYTYEWFAQDNFRILPRLTLNFGGRYTAATSSGAASNELFAAFRPGQQSQIRTDAPPGLVFAGDSGIPNGTADADKKNFAPRVGFAWDVLGSGKLTLRGGYGIFFEYVPGIAQFNAEFSSPPGRASVSIPAPSNFANPLQGVPNPFTGRKIVTPVGFTALAPDLRLPYDQQWNLSVQRELRGGVLVEANYIGTRGTKLLRSREINPAIFGPGATLANTNARRMFAPNFRGISQIENSANSSYHALQLSANKRFSHGLTFLASYVWSKAIDDASFFNISQGTNAGNVNNPQVPSDLSRERGLSLFDVRNRFVLSGVYELPFGKNMSGIGSVLIRGWQTSWIVTLQSGTPFTVLEPRDVSLTGVGADRPNRIGDPNSGPRTVSQAFNTAAFQRLDPVANAGQHGNEGRDVVIGPTLKNFDFSLLKNFHFTERTQFQFRSEFFNIFNHPNFNIPDGNIGSATFGRILDARDPRIIQFGLKVLF